VAAQREDPAVDPPGDPGTVDSAVVGEDSVSSAYSAFYIFFNHVP
jgi:hypothetical protein